MSATRSIIYVSSGHESPEFERKTRETLLKNCGNLPIVAVTQKPVDLGESCKNIVVGEVGASGFNFCRQVQIACENASTDFVISAESDCIYPPDYFQFTPRRLNVPYRNTNIFVQKYKQDFVCKKHSSTFAQIVGREFYIKRLNSLFVDQPMWDLKMRNFPKEINRMLFDEFEYWESENPCVSFKTGNGMRKHSPTGSMEFDSLPYWGNIGELRKYYE